MPATAARVSVALGTHNGARFLGEQLDSILRQTVPVAEIVLSDDASGDGTVELAQQLIAERSATDAATPELVVLRNPVALGVTANFEQAISAASGDLIALSDQDDVWHPDRVARAVAEFAARPEVDLVAAEARLVDDAGAPLGASLFETLGVDAATRERLVSAPFEELLKRNVVTGATMMVTRRLVQRAAALPGELGARRVARRRGVGGRRPRRRGRARDRLPSARRQPDRRLPARTGRQARQAA